MDARIRAARSADTVTKYPRTPEACIAKFVADIREELLTPKSIETYSQAVKIVVKNLDEGKRNTLPYKITEDDVLWLLREKWAHLAIKTRKGYRAILTRYTEHFGNNVVRRVKVRFPHDMRPNIRWLSKEQVVRLMELDMTPLQRIVIHFELFMGLRRVECIRLKMSDVHPDNLMVTGKGGIGGKPRTVPFHHDTPAILAKYIEWRQQQIAIYTKRRPAASITDQLIIYRRGGRLSGFSEEGIDTAVSRKLSAAAGFKFSNHDLRRTFGRQLHKMNVELRTIADLLGHESITETEKYIGIIHDDMVDAMKNLNYKE